MVPKSQEWWQGVWNIIFLPVLQQWNAEHAWEELGAVFCLISVKAVLQPWPCKGLTAYLFITTFLWFCTENLWEDPVSWPSQSVQLQKKSLCIRVGIYKDKDKDKDKDIGSDLVIQWLSDTDDYSWQIEKLKLLFTDN